MGKIPVIIDVDTGTDDAVCITVASLLRDFLNIRALTTVCGNVGVEKTSRNTLCLADYLNLDTKVAVGAKKPIYGEPTPAFVHGETGLGDLILPEANRTFYERSSAELLYETALEEKGELQILAVGPLTNLAIAIQNYPDFKNLIKRITVMGGALYGGNVTMTSEFNIHHDPYAAKIVFASGIPLTMVGLDVTLKPKLPAKVVRKVKESISRESYVISNIFAYMLRRKQNTGEDEAHLHDVIALAAMVCPEMFQFKKYYMEIETNGILTRGMTVADFHCVSGKEPNVRVAVDMDVKRFWKWFISILQA